MGVNKSGCMLSHQIEPRFGHQYGGTIDDSTFNPGYCVEVRGEDKFGQSSVWFGAGVEA